MTNQSQALSTAGEGKSRLPVAVLCVVAVALVAVFAAINPWTADMHARAQAYIAAEAARENKAFCEKRGLAAGTRDYASCVEDLNELRAKQDKRTYESVFGLL